MQIQLEINEKNADFFLEYLNSLKEGIVEKMVITDNVSNGIVVNDINEVHKRIAHAEANAEYIEHDAFWNEMGVSQQMRVVYEKQFRVALHKIVNFIAKDKVSASITFKKELKKKFETLVDNPKMYRASIYYKNAEYRDLVFMGYTAIYKIDGDVIRVLDIFKWMDR